MCRAIAGEGAGNGGRADGPGLTGAAFALAADRARNIFVRFSGGGTSAWSGMSVVLPLAFIACGLPIRSAPLKGLNGRG
ncbi:MAG: hypothetical protein QM656_06050 [Paracoccaceae bacterium]